MKSITLERGGQKRQFAYRENTSDEKVIRQVFAAQHYNLGRLARHQEIVLYLQSMHLAGRRPLIIDAGANIGASSAYLALSFPEAQVVAIEPEPGNFALLSANVEGLNVRCLQAAIAASTGHTRLVDPGIGAWGYRTDPSGGGPEVPTVTVSQVFEEHAQPLFHPFLVKIDIEGGEKDLFEGDTSWVERTAIVVVELHDWLLPRQGTAIPFLRCVSALDRDFVQIGENVFSIDNRLGRNG
jgi:FkbM family methyltransferase